MSASSNPADATFHAHQLRRLLDVSAKLNSTLDLDALLMYIIETAAEVLDCKAASLLLYDASTEQLRFAAATGADPEAIAQIPVPLQGSLAGRIFTEEQTVMVQDVAQSADHFKAVGEKVAFETRSLLGVPMGIEGTMTGVLEALNKRSGTFTQADEEVLKIIAAQAALALRNARQMQFVQQAYDQLEAFDAFKSDFLALASHELRTPLTTILQGLDLLQGNVQSPLDIFARDALGAARRMQEIIETMTQMERLRSEPPPTAEQVRDLRQVLQQAWQDVVAGVEPEQYAFRLDLADVPLMARADDAGLRLAFTNILKNAIQFSSPQSLIHAEMVQNDEHALIRVRDEGIGIDAAHLDKIFDEFYQVEPALTRSQGGLGLGLNIAKRLVQLHGGQMWATSKGLGHGATLYVRLPILPVSSTPTHSAAASSEAET